MYAIIRSGGKQYRVEPGETIYLERLPADAGETVTFDEVLLVGGEGETRVGMPRLEKATVVATVVEQGRDSKVRVFKSKKRKHYRRTRGHRQPFTAVRIDRVQA
ncbi:MAG: 50S ribosomal protein L21 [Acidobacteria bacterium]|nr:50S ribosomal protein L21 [Acidobacteriota bacterium]